uniref:Transmembrane protein n=1 Tax=Dechloromonas aromatica (strain RCB) TaxID=159087 RepID=Q47HC7_DECAR
MQAVMAFENAPPFAAPLRFFLTAPLFAVLAGLLIAFEGPDLFASRWTPGALAATHLLTVGFMLQVMLGALIQILPVVTGANLKRPLEVARIVHVGLSAGALLLASGFYSGIPGLLSSAALVLALTVLLFLAATVLALSGVPSTSPTIRGLKLALLGLAGVVGLGVLMALALAYGWALPLPALADLHAGWGLGGWAGVLLAAMAYVVVPMFQLTPGYPMRASWWFPVAMLGMLLLWSAAVLADWPWLVRLSQFAAAVAGMAFAGLTLRLQAKRRRARADATYRYWQLGLSASIVALLMLASAALWPDAVGVEGWTLVFGVLLVAGGFLPFIAGMLYKIVPFLAWLHLQECGKAKVPAPAMNKLLPDVDTRRQMLAYAAALLLLLATVPFAGWLARPAGLAFAVANGWLWWNLASAIRRYRQAEIDIARKLAAK